MRHVTRLLALVIVGLVLLPLGAADAAQPDRPVVKVGTEGTYPPFSFHDQKTNDLTGYDIDVIKAVAKKAGWKLQFVETTFDAIFAALDADRIDVIANQVTLNPERKAKYLFGTTYTYSRGVLVVKKGRDDIKSLKDLKGKTTAQSITTNYAKLAKASGAKVQGVEGFSQAAALLTQGRVDALINDNIAVLDYLATTGSDKIEIVGDAGDEVNEQAFTFRKDDTELQQEANDAYAALKADGTIAKISEKYFKTDVSIPDGGKADLSDSGRGSSTADTVKDAAWPMFKGLLLASIPITIISFAIGLVIAVAAALARISGIRVLDAIARLYISIIRGTPLLLQLFIVFYGLAEQGVNLSPWGAAILALSINVGAYAAEIVRSAILSVPKGQWEAAHTVGLSHTRSLTRIILPQAARVSVPPLSNTFISLVKDTSLASLILVTELFRQAQIIAAFTYEFMIIYLEAALIYWMFCLVLSAGQGALERRLDRYVAH